MRNLKVGLFLTHWIEGRDGSVPRWSEILEQVRLAVRANFDAIWVPDHLLMQPDGEDRIGGW